jgi:putative transposase
MNRLSLKAAIRVKRYSSWRGDHGESKDNILQRNFKADQPNEKWVTDVTEFAVNGRKLYLSPIIDLFNNEVISYSVSERPAMDMVDEMLIKAFARLEPGNRPVLHSDQGWQYRHRWYQYQLKQFGVLQSMSRRGNCLDNACAECFFSTLKSECFHPNTFSDIDDLKVAIEDYIRYYNNRRISLRLKGLSPVEYRLKVCGHPSEFKTLLVCCMMPPY